MGQLSYEVVNFAFPALALLFSCCIMSAGKQWTAAAYHTCHIFLSSHEAVHNQPSISFKDMRLKGNLPLGVFQRFLAMLISYSQHTSKHNNPRLLFKEAAVVFFGNQRIRIMLHKKRKCITLDIEGKSPIAAYERILDMVDDLLKQGVSPVPRACHSCISTFPLIYPLLMQSRLCIFIASSLFLICAVFVHVLINAFKL